MNQEKREEAAMHEVFPTRRGRHPAALLLILLLHCAVGNALQRGTVARDNPAPASRLDVFFVAPFKELPQPASQIIPPGYTAKPAAPRYHKQEAPAEITPVAPPPPPEAAVPADTDNTVHIVDTAALIGMAGKFDKELRKPGENLLSRPEGKSLRQKMDEAFAAAHLAVPLKWYEAARVELWSAENDPAKIYQVKTAFGTYCLFYPDLQKNPTASPQPRVSSCPVRF
jgi:hypothetical protein